MLTKIVMATIFAYVLGFGFLKWIVFKAQCENKFTPFSENLLRSPGYSLGLQLDHHRDRLFLPVCLIVGTPMLFTMLAPSSLSDQIVFGIVAVLFILLGMYLLSRWYKRNRAIKLGLDGEVYTGQELNFLMRDGAWVYHDIPYTYGNIDHIVVSKGGVFTVETKARRKPANAKGGRECKVQFQGGALNFGSGAESQPILQARRHAEHIGNYLRKRTGNSYPVIPVVALPGWYVVQKEKSDVMVINPKRGGGLRYKVNSLLIPEKEVTIIAQHIEEYARSVESATNLTDPDAHKKYDIFLNRRAEDRKI